MFVNSKTFQKIGDWYHPFDIELFSNRVQILFRDWCHSSSEGGPNCYLSKKETEQKNTKMLNIIQKVEKTHLINIFSNNREKNNGAKESP